MITLITGLPGNGKTLFALWFIKQMAEKEQREVYYHNIKELSLPWTLCEPNEWMSVPDGAIIALDEAQFSFGKKPNGSKLPDYYEQLAVHRHSGKDIFLITQHPSLLDNFVRQLVGRHFHAVRKFGLARSTIYEWSAASPAPQNPTSQKSAISLKWKYPPEVYTYYKSAEVHTVKRAFPLKLILAFAFVLAVPAVGFYVIQSYSDRSKPSDAVPSSVVLTPAEMAAKQMSTSSGPGGLAQVLDPVEDAKRWMVQQTPRVVGLPHTAPKYDQLTVPTRVPVPAMCVQVGTVHSQKRIRCKCFSQQGTPMAVEFNMCIEIAQNGTFLDFDPEPGRKQESVRTPDPARSAPVESQPMVLAFNSSQLSTRDAAPVAESQDSGVRPFRRAIAGSTR